MHEGAGLKEMDQVLGAVAVRSPKENKKGMRWRGYGKLLWAVEKKGAEGMGAGGE